MLAQRIAEHEALAQAADLDDKVLGYRRIVHPELAKGRVIAACAWWRRTAANIGDLKPCTGVPLHGCGDHHADFDPKMVNDEDLSRLYGDAQSNYRRALVRVPATRSTSTAGSARSRSPRPRTRPATNAPGPPRRAANSRPRCTGRVVDCGDRRGARGVGSDRPQRSQGIWGQCRSPNTWRHAEEVRRVAAEEGPERRH